MPAQILRRIEWWGHLSTYWGALRSDPMHEGLLREPMIDGFTYVLNSKELAAMKLSGLETWNEFTGVFEMNCSTHPVDDLISLLNLGKELRDRKDKLHAQQKELERTDPNLQRLDAAADLLLDLVARLDEKGIGVGLLTPRNVLVPRTGNARHLILPDIGFVANQPEAVDWLVQGQQNPWWKLWQPLSPAQQQVSSGPKRPSAEHACAVLARLFMVVLLGEDWLRNRKECTVPSEDEDPENRENRETLDEVWTVLQDVAPGAGGEGKRNEAITLNEFREQLKANPLSQFFLSKKKLIPRGTARWWRSWVATVLCVGLLVVGWLLIRPFILSPDPSNPTGDPVKVGVEGPLPLGSPLSSLVNLFDATAPEKGGPTVMAMYAKDFPQQLDPGDRARELWWKERCRRRFCDGCYRRYLSALELEIPTNTYQIVKELYQALVPVHELPTANEGLLTEENQCLALLHLYLQQWE